MPDSTPPNSARRIVRCLLLKAEKCFEQALERGVLTPEIPFSSKQGKFISHEESFVLRLPAKTRFSLEHMEPGEKDSFHALKWWKPGALREASEAFESREAILDLPAAFDRHLTS